MAGTCDFIDDERKVIVDFKSMSTKKDTKIKPYDEWLMQLGAYAGLYEHTDYECQNIVISTTEPGRIEVIKHDPEDIAAARREFHYIYEAFRCSKRL
jgi:CRISPR/Cas system-associated exonuclease Cas4 (RecB family)